MPACLACSGTKMFNGNGKLMPHWIVMQLEDQLD